MYWLFKVTERATGEEACYYERFSKTKPSLDDIFSSDVYNVELVSTSNKTFLKVK